LRRAHPRVIGGYVAASATICDFIAASLQGFIFTTSLRHRAAAYHAVPHHTDADTEHLVRTLAEIRAEVGLAKPA
jgi:7-keto-8-aminopelargonate synthetase-like enzyme